LWRPSKVRIHVFPNNVAFGRNLEKTAKPTFVDESVAVQQSPSISNSRTEKIRYNFFLKFPHNILRRRIDFEHAREWKCVVQPMGSVIEDQYMAIFEKIRRMLAGKWRSTKLPGDCSVLAVDHDDG